MAFTVLDNAREIAEAFAALHRTLTSGARVHRGDIGYQGASGKAELHWQPAAGFWVCMDPVEEPIRNRYWCAYGLGDPATGPGNIVVEVNPPTSGIDRRCAGAFVRDDDGVVHLAHNGRIGGGRFGIGKAAFWEHYQGQPATVRWGTRGDVSQMVVIGRVDSPELLPALAAFVREVDRIKRVVVGVERRTAPAGGPGPARVAEVPPRTSGGDVRAITDALLALGKKLDAERPEGLQLIPTLSPESARLVVEDPFAFCLGASLDRGIPAEVAWTFPFWIKEELGHLDPHRIASMGLDELRKVLQALPRKPRYFRDAPRTVKEMARLVVEVGGGDASALWRGKTAAEVERLFRSVHGVGSGIASMVVILLEKVYKLRFTDLDHRKMNVKPDVHVIRVLGRLGVLSSGGAAGGCRATDASSQEGAAIAATRAMHPEYPGALDTPLWVIGREWCDALSPRCADCPMGHVCARTIFR